MAITLDKAIEILELVSDTPPSGANPDFKDANKLGIEALKRCRVIQQESVLKPFALLPGETKN